MIATYISLLTAISSLASAGLVRRSVTELDQAAFAEAQQRDDTAIRAISNMEIKTSDGRCLFVDDLSGDFRANLTPIQIATCGTTPGQGWDVITQGKHNHANGSVLIVSALTQACFSYDPRRAAGNQVVLFSCGGRADGSGEVTKSQLFATKEAASPLSFAAQNEVGSCLSVNGNVMDIANCQVGNPDQSFTFGDTASDSEGVAKVDAASCNLTSSVTTSQQTMITDLPPFTFTGVCEPVTVTVTAAANTIPTDSTASSTTTTIFVTITPMTSPTNDITISSTTTIFVTVGPPSKSTDDITVSSTTTVFVTVGPSSVGKPSASTTATTAQVATEVATSVSTTNEIPRVSISPSTTVILSP